MRGKRRQEHAKKGALLLPILKEFFEAEIESGCTHAEVARQFNVTPGCARNWLNKNTVPAPFTIRKVVEVLEGADRKIPSQVKSFLKKVGDDPLYESRKKPQPKKGPAPGQPVADTYKVVTYTLSVSVRQDQDSDKLATRISKTLGRTGLRVVVHESLPMLQRPPFQEQTIEQVLSSLVRREIRTALDGARLDLNGR